MVKLIIVGRVRDGLPLAQGHRCITEDNDSFAAFKKQGEFILAEISCGALANPTMTIQLGNNHCFHYLVEEDIFFTVLCDSTYPRKLAFSCLQDLQLEFQKFDKAVVEKISRPYSFTRFDNVTQNLRRQYTDTRTHANLSKLKTNCQKDLSLITEHISEIVERRRQSGRLERMMTETRVVSPIWGSPRLEVIALKWTPITLILGVAGVLFWASLILTDRLVI